MAEIRPELRAGIIGGGFMAAVHSRAVLASGARLHTIASSTPARSSEAARRLGIPHTSRDAEALLADPNVDVVHICTPNATHERFAVMALTAGKHVVCEKPLATDAASAAALARLARDTGRVATVPFVYRYHPMVREARARVRDGKLGRILHVTGSYLQDWLLEAGDDNWRVDSASGGSSRAFADIGSHLVDLVEFVTGARIEALSATTTVAHEQRGGSPVHTEDAAHVLARLSGGAHASLVVSQVAAGHKNDLRFEVFGSDASLVFAQEQPDVLQIGRRSHTSTLTRDAARLDSDAARLSLVPDGHPMGYQDAFSAFVRDTYALIEGEQAEGVPTFDDGARAAEITAAVLRSAASGLWTPIPATEKRTLAA